MNCCKQHSKGVSRIYVILSKDGIIVYVGQTTHSIRCRLSRHVCDARKNGLRTHFLNWIHTRLKEGYRPEIKLLEEVPLEIADERERFWIAHYRQQGVKLYNLADGGRMCGFLGQRHTPESRKIMSEKARQRPPMTEETKRKIVVGSIGRVQSKEEKEKRAASLRGKKRSEEFRKKCSERALIQMRERRKPVIQLSASLQSISIFGSIREAAKATGLWHPLISRAAKRPTLKCGGFYWRYANGNS